MNKISIERDSRRVFNEHCENVLLFIENSPGKPICIVCESTFSHSRRHNRHYTTQHHTYIEEKMKFVPVFELTKKKEEIRR